MTTIRCYCLMLALSLAARPAAADPCGGIRLDSGVVKTGTPLPAATVFSADDQTCAQAIATAIKARPRVRSVTIAVRSAADKRTDGAQIAALWTKSLTAAGVIESRISAIIPTSPVGTPMEVSLAYREPQPRPVALVQSLTGKASSASVGGPMSAVSIGATLAQGDTLVTEIGATARLALADGSHVVLYSDSEASIGCIELTADLKRSVKLHLLRGRIEAFAETKARGGSFEIISRAAVAGARGTVFRVSVGPSGETNVQTLDGNVELQSVVGTKLAATVGAGMFSSVDATGNVAPVQPLLPRPLVLPPLSGPRDRAEPLQWRSVDGAVSYVVEMGGDGELATQLRFANATATTLQLPADLAKGYWFWRVIAVDKAGVVGMPSRTYSFVVR